MSVIIPVPTRHTCVLPDESAKYELGTLAQCPACRSWWHWAWPADDFAGSWMMPCWNPVRWYHWRIRRRIKQTEASR